MKPLADPAYRGRFAPSPTGPLHAGSLVAALASWLDARAHGGRWLLRIEDLDAPRCPPGMAGVILEQLARCGLVPDEPVCWQSQRSALYQAALAQLAARGLAYPCACSRSDIDQQLQAQGTPRTRHAAAIYPGTCRTGLQGRPARAWRLNVERTLAECGVPNPLRWFDRHASWQQQDVAREVGDFVLHRADGLWAYQLAVVVDDAAQGISHVVRGQDLADSTARQVLLQHALGLPTPRYWHTPLVRDAKGEKLSKQSGAKPLALATPDAVLAALNRAAATLGLAAQSQGVAHALQTWTEHCPPAGSAGPGGLASARAARSDGGG